MSSAASSASQPASKQAQFFFTQAFAQEKYIPKIPNSSQAYNRSAYSLGGSGIRIGSTCAFRDCGAHIVTSFEQGTQKPWAQKTPVSRHTHMFPGLSAAAYSHCECKQTVEIPKDWEDDSKPEAKNNNSTRIIRAAQIHHTWEYVYMCVLPPNWWSLLAELECWYKCLPKQNLQRNLNSWRRSATGSKKFRNKLAPTNIKAEKTNLSSEGGKKKTKLQLQKGRQKLWGEWREDLSRKHNTRNWIFFFSLVKTLTWRGEGL